MRDDEPPLGHHERFRVAAAPKAAKRARQLGTFRGDRYAHAYDRSQSTLLWRLAPSIPDLVSPGQVGLHLDNVEFHTPHPSILVRNDGDLLEAG